jgi:hypothetical protein
MTGECNLQWLHEFKKIMTVLTYHNFNQYIYCHNIGLVREVQVYTVPVHGVPVRTAVSQQQHQYQYQYQTTTQPSHTWQDQPMKGLQQTCPTKS